MEKTKIDWCDSTWNPVTGCLHECEYCYARRIANRFKGHADLDYFMELEKHPEIADEKVHVLDAPLARYDFEASAAPYPFGFEPTLHGYRLNDYINKKGRNIFVCSMADLFGDWVPDSWIEEVFNACERASQHNYLFLTKNLIRYEVLHQKGIMRKCQNMWYGYSYTSNKSNYWYDSQYQTFASIEPILEPINSIPPADWIIIGAETGNRKDKVIPEKSWVDNIVEQCRALDIPVFMKESLRALYGDNLLREFPQGLIRG